MLSTPIYIISHFNIFSKIGSLLLCAHGWAGQTQLPFSWRRISQSEIRNSATDKYETVVKIIGVLGIEPRLHAPKACVLPLYYTP